MRKIVMAAAIATSALGLAACSETADEAADMDEAMVADTEANTAEMTAEMEEGAMEAETAMEDGASEVAAEAEDAAAAAEAEMEEAE